MATFKDRLAELTNAKHFLAVWEALHTYLDSGFVTRDSRTAIKALRVPDCLVEVVPEEIVEQVLQQIGDGPIKDLRARIETIENQEIELKKGKS